MATSSFGVHAAVREKYDQRNDIDKTQSSCSTCCVPMVFRDPVLHNDSVHVEWARTIEDMRLTALAIAHHCSIGSIECIGPAPEVRR
jgi:hypothetical protein